MGPEDQTLKGGSSGKLLLLLWFFLFLFFLFFFFLLFFLTQFPWKSFYDPRLMSKKPMIWWSHLERTPGHTDAPP